MKNIKYEKSNFCITKKCKLIKEKMSFCRKWKKKNDEKNKEKCEMKIGKLFNKFQEKFEFSGSFRYDLNSGISS